MSRRNRFLPSRAASPALLVGSCFLALGGVLVIADEGGVRFPFVVPYAARVGVGALWLAVMVVALAATYYGHPRWALLPALRSRESYARFMQGTA